GPVAAAAPRRCRRDRSTPGGATGGCRRPRGWRAPGHRRPTTACAGIYWRIATVRQAPPAADPAAESAAVARAAVECADGRGGPTMTQTIVSRELQPFGVELELDLSRPLDD